MTGPEPVRPVSRPSRPGAWLRWFRPVGRRTGYWAFTLNRLTGLLLAGYLFLHLAVLSILARGPEAYNAFVEAMSIPIVEWSDLLLLLIILVHALNGVRVGLLGLGFATAFQKSAFWAALVAAAIFLAYGAVRILGPSGGIG